MFEVVEMAPPDPILGLTEAFREDPNPEKINLSVGVYQDSSGATPVLEAVKQAEQRLLQGQRSKSYRPIDGGPEYRRQIQQLMFGREHEAITSGRAATAQTPGGTGALRVAGDYLAAQHRGATVWLSDPTWANHAAIFKAAGLAVKTYPYYDPQSKSLAFERMVAALRQVPRGDVVLLHGCCHNPTGVDPSPDQWKQIGDVLDQRGALPLVDFAYQGFGDGLEEDAAGVMALLRPGCEMFICSSFSKNFGLYNERVGALTVVAANAQAARAVHSQIKVCIRANYSNPPAHGADIVQTILTDPELSRLWLRELTQMRDRINGMRRLFVRTLDDMGVPGDRSFLAGQKGMFSFSGLTAPQVQALRDRFSIYLVSSGRINVAGMSESNMPRLCEAIKAVS